MKEIYRDQSCWPLILTQAANLNSLPLFKKMAAALRNQKLTVDEVIQCVAACEAMGVKDEDFLSWGIGKMPDYTQSQLAFYVKTQYGLQHHVYLPRIISELELRNQKLTTKNFISIANHIALIQPLESVILANQFEWLISSNVKKLNGKTLQHCLQLSNMPNANTFISSQT